MRTGPVDPALTRALRRRILRPELPLDAALPGDDIPNAWHVAAWLDDSVASTCFIYPDPCPWRPEVEAASSWHLRQMATAEHARGQGAGQAVIDAVIEYLDTHQAKLVWCNARETAVEFYRRCGFRGEGELFTDDRHSIPHLRMWRLVAPLPKRPTDTS
jgi:predicted GNAT family N-acyltransferase